MTHTCPACGADDAVFYAHLAPPARFQVPDCFRCEECGAVFKVEEDADYVNERWRDCSSPGAEIIVPNEVAEQRVAALLQEPREQAHQLVNKHLRNAARRWHARFPKRSVRVLFGNGTYLLEIDGEPVHDYDDERRHAAVRELSQAISFADELCDREGLEPPDDFFLSPRPFAARRAE